MVEQRTHEIMMCRNKEAQNNLTAGKNMIDRCT